MESKLKHLAHRLIPRQQALEFTLPEHWQYLPRSDQQACRHAIAKLLCQVIAQSLENEDE